VLFLFRWMEAVHHDPPLAFKAKFRAAIERVIAKARLCQGEQTRSERASPAMAREYFLAWEKLIELYRSPQNAPDNRPREIIPPDVMGMLGRLCGYVASGIIPGPIKDATTPGGHVPGPTERRDKEIAVSYVAAAKTGKIKNRAPVKTVAEIFGVNRRTVLDWSKEFPILNIEPGRLPKLLERAGEGYRSAGRSEPALRGRWAKAPQAKSNASVTRGAQQISYEPYCELSRDERIEDIKKALEETG
jgi:hypothetical protein